MAESTSIATAPLFKIMAIEQHNQWYGTETDRAFNLPRMVFGDFDGDGLLDKLTIEQGVSKPASVLLYRGTGTIEGIRRFTENPLTVFELEKAEPCGIQQVADVDGDGDLDVNLYILSSTLLLENLTKKRPHPKKP